MIFQAGLYIRLSKEDNNESIKNQKNLLIKYANDLNYQIIDTYIDDGYTGTNFNRPAFQRLIQDIKANKINTVIVKDLSRLGRDYIKTGELVEHFFPINNIRFIAITDNIDTYYDNSNNDIAPFKAILNDMYAKDLSKKIRTAIKTMQINGIWTGGCLPLGYQKDPKHKNKIMINAYEAQIVKRIFNIFTSKQSLKDTKNYLNSCNIPTFSKIRLNKNTKWSTISIKKILTNAIYIGDLIQNKHQRLSYKYRKIINNPQENWIITKHNHPAIISPKTFAKTQTLLLTPKKKASPRLLDELLYCKECNHHLGIRKKNKQGYSYLCCNYYRANYKKKLCTAHAFNYETLETDIINIIKKHLNKNIIIDNNLINSIIEKITISQNKEVTIFFKFKNITK